MLRSSMFCEIERSGRSRGAEAFPAKGADFTLACAQTESSESARSGMISDPALLALVTRAQAEDRDAQSELVRCYSGRIAGFVRPMMRGGDAVEDIVQLIMIKMCRRLPGLREAALFESWLFMLSRNTVLDQLRRAKLRPVSVIDPTPWLDREPAEEASGRCREIMEEVERATLNCSDKDRRILRLVLDGASYQTIAKFEELTIGALKLRVHRLRLLLRASLRGDCVHGLRSPSALR